MSEEIKKAYKLFNREDLIDDGYERDLDSNIQVFLTTKQMINYMNLQQKVEQLEKQNKILKENAEHNDKVVDKVNWENMLLKRKNKEIERLNNITSKLEKWLKENAEKDTYSSIIFGVVLNYFQELKDSD